VSKNNLKIVYVIFRYHMPLV